MKATSILAGTICAVAFLSSPSVVRGESGRCLRAEVPSPMVFPDGSEHTAGTLTLCVEDYSPVASYHKVSVNGHPVGFLFSLRRIPERQKSTEPIVVFRKTKQGKLRLTGYLWPSGEEAVSYLLQGEPWDARAQTRIPALETPPPTRATDGENAQ